MNRYSIHKTILIKAPIDAVYTALTDSEAIIKYLPITAVESDWLEGSEVLYHGEVDGVAFTDFGIIETLDRPEEYRYRYWSDNHGTERLPENYVTIRYILSPANQSCLLTVIQNNIPSEAMWQLMNTEVWGFLLKSLKAYLEQP